MLFGLPISEQSDLGEPGFDLADDLGPGCWFGPHDVVCEPEGILAGDEMVGVEDQVNGLISAMAPRGNSSLRAVKFYVSHG